MITGRIQELLSVYNLSVSEFADKIKVPRSSMSHITSGRNKPSLDFVMKVKESFPSLNTDWIIFGKGKMYIQKEESKSQINSIEESEQNLTPTLFEDDDLNKKPKIEPKKGSIVSTNQQEILNTPQKQLRNVMFFYTDGTFEKFKPD